ncbi:jg27121 [Pararge aegeria aegeria]|uniref:Jg27121 protein n=5 Tax=Pararge aegeria TaxID=116150 RepID=A0A8S4RC21_9NEOP|nr:jg27121 [Pararge aegeria aegeria]
MQQSSNLHHKTYFSLLNENSVQQYKAYLQRSSNVTSNVLLEESWRANSHVLNNFAIDGILDSARQLLKNSKNRKEMSSAWESSISNLPDPLLMFEKSMQCKKCSESNKANTEFMKTDCRCEPPIPKSDIIIVESSQNSSQESKDETKIFKPRLCNSRLKKSVNKFVPTSTKDCAMNKIKGYSRNSQECNIEHEHYPSKSREYDSAYNISSKNKEYSASNDRGLDYNIEVGKPKTSTNMDIDMEEEAKAHKSQIAKLTFKTAKEQLLASNPAARRTLGASRKAQAKFISPMLGAM